MSKLFLCGKRGLTYIWVELTEKIKATETFKNLAKQKWDTVREREWVRLDEQRRVRLDLYETEGKEWVFVGK